MKTRSLDEYRNVLHTEDRKTWFDIGVEMFKQGEPEPQGPKWSRKKVRDQMIEYGWNAASACSQNVQDHASDGA